MTNETVRAVHAKYAMPLIVSAWTDQSSFCSAKLVRKVLVLHAHKVVVFV